MDTKINIASFDIGKNNFAFLIEEIDISLLETIVNIPLSQRYNIDSYNAYSCILFGI